MFELAQSLWDQMRAELDADALRPLQEAHQALESGRLGPLTEQQVEDLQSIQRSIEKLTRRMAGEPINWDDYSEAAHALRGPLNATIGFSRLMLKGVEGPITAAQGEALEAIYSASRRMLVLFNLLLDALLVSHHNIEIKSEPVAVDELMDKVATLGKALAEARSLAFEAQVSDVLAGTWVTGDTERLKQALSGLLAVAGKYATAGKLLLHARADQAQVAVQIQARPCQLPSALPADLSTLLTAQADPALPFDTHLRLGLAWRFLRAMNADLQVSRADETCTFTITFPLA